MSAEHRRIHRGGGDRPVRSVRRWVKASGSGCCARRNRPGSSTARRGEDPAAIIVVGFLDESEQTHGCRRIHAEPARGGVKASLGMVRGIVAAAGPVARRPRGRAGTDRAGAGSSGPARPAGRDVTATAPGMRRVGDITHGPARRGSAHPAVVVDCSPGRGRRARDRRSHARRTRRRSLGHGRAGPVHRSAVSRSSTRIGGGSMHVGRMHGIHGRPRDSPVRRADRQPLWHCRRRVVHRGLEGGNS